MEKHTLKILAIAISALLVIVLLVGLTGGGLDKQIKALAKAELSNLEQANAQIARDAKSVSKLLSDEPELLKANGGDIWVKTPEKLKKQLSEQSANAEKIRQLLKDNNKDNRGELEETIYNISGVRIAVISESAEIRQKAVKLIEFKKDISAKLAKLESDHNTLISLSAGIASLNTQVEKAIVDWPDKKSDLQRRIGIISKTSEDATNLWKSTESDRVAAKSNKVTNSNVLNLHSASEKMFAYRTSIEESLKHLPKLIDQLYWSWDMILEDMEIREGSIVTFHHKLQKVMTRALAGENEKAENKSVHNWKQINKTEYEASKKNLGMAVMHKNAGKYDHEAEQMTQPAGFAYVASPEKGRNSYGYWSHGNGGSFWTFYGQYAFMRDVFWGPSYRPITTSHYHDYHSARSSGRTYYGRDNFGRSKYGSDGTITKSKYSSSKYVRTGGFKNSQYVKSGGSYRGTRYASSSRNYSNTSYGSSRSSRSRSRSGYRSSSRSGSRFGGGK